MIYFSSPKSILLPQAFISTFTLLGFTFSFSLFLTPCPSKPLSFIYILSKPLQKSTSFLITTTSFQITILQPTQLVLLVSLFYRLRGPSILSSSLLILSYIVFILLLSPPVPFKILALHFLVL